MSTTGGGERQGPEGRRTPPRLLHAPERGTYQLRELGGPRIKVVVSGLLIQKTWFWVWQEQVERGRGALGGLGGHLPSLCPSKDLRQRRQQQGDPQRCVFRDGWPRLSHIRLHSPASGFCMKSHIWL